MNDQKKLWNVVHKDGNVDHYSTNPTPFVTEVLEVLKPHSKILELGCGAGNDSVALAKATHNVLATDFSDVALSKNREKYKDIKNLIFAELDMSKEFQFEENTFDAIYARLSLHYFTDETTKKIVSNIHRVLKPNGELFFICKSVKDSLYGKGTELEKDIYELDGHIRHFFSEEYCQELLNEGFTISKLESGNENFYGNNSSYVKVFAKVNKS